MDQRMSKDKYYLNIADISDMLSLFFSAGSPVL